MAKRNRPKEEYWICIIGPVDGNTLPKGADAPMRSAVEKAFKELTGHYADACGSGWGNDGSDIDRMNQTWNANATRRVKRP